MHSDSLANWHCRLATGNYRTATNKAGGGVVSWRCVDRPRTAIAADRPVANLGMQNRRECDVLVVGGGPAGSTVAALLAQTGRHVVVLEKDRFPRFHIGESLLPLNLPLFECLGIADQVERIGVYKPGAEVVSNEHAQATTFRFDRNPYLSVDHSYHVRRADFDKLLL